MESGMLLKGDRSSGMLRVLEWYFALGFVDYVI
jgi:hypothetical protein